MDENSLISALNARVTQEIAAWEDLINRIQNLDSILKESILSVHENFLDEVSSFWEQAEHDFEEVKNTFSDVEKVFESSVQKVSEFADDVPAKVDEIESHAAESISEIKEVIEELVPQATELATGFIEGLKSTFDEATNSTEEFLKAGAEDSIKEKIKEGVGILGDKCTELCENAEERIEYLLEITLEQGEAICHCLDDFSDGWMNAVESVKNQYMTVADAIHETSENVIFITGVAHQLVASTSAGINCTVNALDDIRSVMCGIV